MHFLHKGIPQRTLEATWAGSGSGDAAQLHFPGPISHPARALLRLLAHPNIASKDRLCAPDHEVRGGTVIKPPVGAAADGPTRRCSSAARLLGAGARSGNNPRYGQIDLPMALACVDGHCAMWWLLMATRAP